MAHPIVMFPAVSPNGERTLYRYLLRRRSGRVIVREQWHADQVGADAGAEKDAAWYGPATRVLAVYQVPALIVAGRVEFIGGP